MTALRVAGVVEAAAVATARDIAAAAADVADVVTAAAADVAYTVSIAELASETEVARIAAVRSGHSCPFRSGGRTTSRTDTW